MATGEQATDRIGTARPYAIGLTGNIATGKSTVVGMLRELGATAIDADTVYHELIQPGRPVWQALRERFGPVIVGPDQQIDRRALGEIVFRDPGALADLDAITHPAVIAEVRARLARSTHPLVVVDAVKLIESGMADDYDEIWVIISEPERQIERLMNRNGLSRTEAAQRVKAQPPLAPKLERADIVIDNSGTLAETRLQVEAAWKSRGHAERLKQPKLVALDMRHDPDAPGETN